MTQSSNRHQTLSTTTVNDRVAELMRSLAHTGELVTELVRLPEATITVEVTRPVDVDTLLEQATADPEQNLPYWAEIWPSGVALASLIAKHSDRLAGRRVLELGCGLGITAALAVAAGARLTAVDYAAEALTLTRVTTLRHTGQEPASVYQRNWRSSSIRDLANPEPYPVILAADVLYERRDVDPLIVAIDGLLADDGELWLAHPERESARNFVAALLAKGWREESIRWSGPWPDPQDRVVTVWTHRLTRPERGTLDIPDDPLHNRRSRS